MRPLNGGAHSLMDRLVRDTEDTINKLKARRESLEAEIVTLQAEEDEARGVLHFLKTGKEVEISVEPAVREKPLRNRKKAVSKEDFLDAINIASDEGKDGEFTAADIGALLGQDPTTSSSRLGLMAKNNDYIRVTSKSILTPQGRTFTYYRKLRPPA